MIKKDNRNVTLLIHYASPGTVKDDRKWKRMVDSMINMKTIAGVKLLDLPETESHTPTSYQLCQLRQMNTSQVRSFASSKPPMLNEFSNSPIDLGPQEALFEQEVNQKKRHGSPRQTQQRAVKRFRVGSSPADLRRNTAWDAFTSLARTKQRMNPPFKNPVITSKYKVQKSCQCTQEQSLAPEATVLVPFSGTPQRWRCKSDSFLFSNVSSSFKEHTQQFSIQTPVLRRSDRPEHLSMKDRIGMKALAESRNNAGDCRTNSNGGNSFLDQVGIGGLADETRDQIHHYSSPEFGTSFLEGFICSGVSDYPATTRSQSSFGNKSIGSLPMRVECEVPITQMGDFKTVSIPDHLDRLARKECLQRRFRPVFVERDVRTTERGYWKILVKVSSPQKVAASRLPTISISQSSDIRYLLRREGKISRNTSNAEIDAMVQDVLYPDLRDLPKMLWTRKEFLQVFEALTSFIKRGRAGWATRAVLLRGQEVDGEIDIEVRIYHFGQIVAHIWLALLWLSEGLTDHMRLEWIGSDRRTIIRMAGHEERCGDLGYWECKQDGKAGLWGLQSCSPPIDVGCDRVQGIKGTTNG